MKKPYNTSQDSVESAEEPLILPRPRLQERLVHPERLTEALDLGLEPTIANILARRLPSLEVPLQDWLAPRLSHLSHPQQMADMEKAAQRVAQAIVHGEHIGIETDHDCDGQTSHAVIYTCLRQHFRHPAEKLHSFIGHRLNEGYGLSADLTKRILQTQPRPSLVITADNGSSDEPRIALLKMANIDVIVTDHHEIPQEGIPKSAYACLNPTREDCRYPDPCIAGCMVAWLLMTGVRKQLIALGHLSEQAPALSDVLDFVAVGTVADCVSMARSHNNRAIVRAGMRLIEQGLRPCWRVLQSSFPSGKVNAEFLGFRIGPLLNSDGRLATAFQSVSFLLSDTELEARAWVDALEQQNQARKAIQRRLVQTGMRMASGQVALGRYSLCLFLPEGHPGVHGIAASRLKDAFGRPTVFLAPKVHDETVLTGSVRGIEGFHVRKALQMVADGHPSLLLSFGGHQGAGGLSFARADLALFSEAFEQAVKSQLNDNLIGPVIWTDGISTQSVLNLGFLDRLKTLEPFGREFDAPIFELPALITDLKTMGDGTHARLQVQDPQGNRWQGVWFGLRPNPASPLPVELGQAYRMAFSLREQVFRGERRIDAQIHEMVV